MLAEIGQINPNAQMASKAALAARPGADGAPGPARVALLASLPETMPASIREQCLDAGVVPLQGLREGLEALNLCGAMGECWRQGSQVTMLRPAAARAGDGGVDDGGGVRHGDAGSGDRLSWLLGARS